MVGGVENVSESGDIIFDFLDFLSLLSSFYYCTANNRSTLLPSINFLLLLATPRPLHLISSWSSHPLVFLLLLTANTGKKSDVTLGIRHFKPQRALFVAILVIPCLLLYRIRDSTQLSFILITTRTAIKTTIPIQTKQRRVAQQGQTLPPSTGPVFRALLHPGFWSSPPGNPKTIQELSSARMLFQN